MYKYRGKYRCIKENIIISSKIIGNFWGFFKILYFPNVYSSSAELVLLLPTLRDLHKKQTFKQVRKTC